MVYYSQPYGLKEYNFNFIRAYWYFF